MLFLPIIFISLAFAQEELQVETYCFTSVPARTRTEKKLQGIMVPSDKLESENNCLTLQMRPHRRELLQNYARSIDPDFNITFSSAEVKREPCLLQVEKVRALKSDGTILEASLPQVTASSKKVNESSKDVMQIQTLNDFSFTVAQDAIEGKCRYINKDLYEITINARRDPKPLVPPGTPSGVIVVVQTPPPDQKTLSVTTTLQLNRGARIEIGSIVKDLRKKDRDISISPAVGMNNVEQDEEEKVFLSFQ